MITQKRLKELLYYNELSGNFVRVYSTGGMRRGTVAGRIVNGYIRISVDYEDIYAHRLAWLYMEGYIPTNLEIDHIDRNPSNNKWSNLRLVSRSCNMINTGPGKANKSGIVGVGWDKKEDKWRAQIKRGGKSTTIGLFNEKIRAAMARWKAEVRLGFSTCNTLSTALQYIKENEEIL